MNVQIFVQNIKRLCAQRGISPTAACKDSGVGTSFIPDIKRGRIPSIDKFEKLALYFGVTISELLGERKTGIVELSYGLPPKNTLNEVFEAVETMQPHLLAQMKSAIQDVNPPLSSQYAGPYSFTLDARIQSCQNAPSVDLRPPETISRLELSYDEQTLIRSLRKLPPDQENIIIGAIQSLIANRNPDSFLQGDEQ